jgi:hypothetical protein
MHKGDEIFFCDSAPKPSHRIKMEEVALRTNAKGIVLEVPRQPVESSQCGLHLIVHSILFGYGIRLSVEQFPYLDLDVLRGGITSTHQILDHLFSQKLTGTAELQVGDVFVSKENDIWFTGKVGSKRRGMITIDGWRVGAQPTNWATVWTTAVSHQVLVLKEARQFPLVPPAPTRQSRRRGRAPGEPVNIPLPASHHQTWIYCQQKCWLSWKTHQPDRAYTLAQKDLSLRHIPTK